MVSLARNEKERKIEKSFNQSYDERYYKQKNHGCLYLFIGFVILMIITGLIVYFLNNPYTVPF